MTKKLIDSIINFIESNDVEDNIIKEYIDKIVNKNNPTIRTVSNRYSLIKKIISLQLVHTHPNLFQLQWQVDWLRVG